MNELPVPGRPLYFQSFKTDDHISSLWKMVDALRRNVDSLAGRSIDGRNIIPGTITEEHITTVAGLDTTAFHTGGDSFGATARLGTNDAFDIEIERGGTLVATFSSSALVLPAGNKLQLGASATPLGDGTEILPIVHGVNAGLRLIMENTNTSTAAHCTLGAISNENNDCQIGVLNSGFTTTGVHVAGDGFVVLSHGAGTSTNTARHLVVANRLATGSLKLGAGDAIWATMLSNGVFLLNATAQAASERFRVNGAVYVDSTSQLMGKVGIGNAPDATDVLKATGTSMRLITSTFSTFYGMYEPGSAMVISANIQPTTGTIPDSGRSAAALIINAPSGGSSFTFQTAAANNTAPTTRIEIGSGGGIVTTPADAGHSVYNEGGLNADHRWEGENKESCLLIDASDDEVAIDGRFSLIDSTPAQITGDQNDYAGAEGTATSRSTVWRISSDAARNVTGLAGGLQGRRLILINVGAQNIVIQNENAGSTVANRVITGTGADITLSADDTMELWYDSTTARWRVIG